MAAPTTLDLALQERFFLVGVAGLHVGQRGHGQSRAQVLGGQGGIAAGEGGVHAVDGDSRRDVVLAVGVASSRVERSEILTAEAILAQVRAIVDQRHGDAA